MAGAKVEKKTGQGNMTEEKGALLVAKSASSFRKEGCNKIVLKRSAP